MPEKSDGGCVVSDYMEAAVLRAYGFSMLRVDQREDGRCCMVFEDLPGDDRTCEAVLLQHRRGELSLNTIDVTDSLSAVKNAIFSVRGRWKGGGNGKA